MSTQFNLLLKSLILSVLGFTLGCQTTTSSTKETLTLIYGATNNNKKAIYLNGSDGKSPAKLVDTPSDGGGYPAVSPSGKQVAFYGKYDNRRTWSIHTVYTDGSNMRRLTNKRGVWDSAPAWSPDGQTIAFAREYKDQNGWQVQLWLMNADGTEQRQIPGLIGGAPEYLADGRLLFYCGNEPTQICIANSDGSERLQLTYDESNNYSPKISPDGLQIAYLSNRDGNQELYVMNIDGSQQIRLTKNRIQEWGPVWSADGKKVFFSSQNVYGFYDIYKANKDGSSIEKVLSNGSQGSAVKYLDPEYLARLMAKQ